MRATPAVEPVNANTVESDGTQIDSPAVHATNMKANRTRSRQDTNATGAVSIGGAVWGEFILGGLRDNPVASTGAFIRRTRSGRSASRIASLAGM